MRTYELYFVSADGNDKRYTYTSAAELVKEANKHDDYFIHEVTKHGKVTLVEKNLGKLYRRYDGEYIQISVPKAFDKLK